MRKREFELGGDELLDVRTPNIVCLLDGSNLEDL